MGQWEYKYPEQEGETATVSLALQSLFLSSPPLKIYGGPWGEMEECATAHSRAKSTLTASNAKHSHARLSVFKSCAFLFVLSFFCHLVPFSLALLSHMEKIKAFMVCREIYADAKLLFLFFYFERLPYLPTVKHHITQQLEIVLSFLYGYIFCTSSIGFLLTY